VEICINYFGSWIICCVFIFRENSCVIGEQEAPEVRLVIDLEVLCFVNRFGLPTFKGSYAEFSIKFSLKWTPQGPYRSVG
jgi:hypothetical protein